MVYKGAGYIAHKAHCTLHILTKCENMASCYKCGSGGANYRRYVNTGVSFGSWTSRRSGGSSARSYYGVRSVCEGCAAAIDKWRNIKWAFIFFMIGLFLLAKIF